jgi:serine/threonine protein kinase
VDHLKEEYVTSQQLELCDHCHHILIAVQEDDTNTFRMYSDYAEHGDLNDLLSIYYQEENLKQQIPEQFIWMIFHAMADALGALDTGECGETFDEERAIEEREEGGKGKGKSKKGVGVKKKPGKPFSGAMVHLDIKPANVFLNTAQAPYGAYSRPILADYDVVKIVSHGTNTAAERRTWGTRGYKAPEIVNEALHHHPVNAKADIWSLDMLVWKMMHTTLGKERSDEICVDSIKASFQFADGNTFTSVDIPGYDAMYSNALHQLVTDCLQINPEKRPGHEYVRRKAKAEFERSQRRLGKVQTDVEDGSDLANHLRLLRGEDSVYKIGAKFQEPPSKKRKTDAPPDEAVEV